MPNHVTTRCVVVGAHQDIKRFRDKAFLVKDKILTFDFNAFIPMPSSIAETQSGTTAEEGAALVSLTQGHAPPRLKPLAGRHSDDTQLRPARITHMRETLNMPEASLTELAKAWLDKYPEYRTEGEKRLRAISETGFPDWYDWACHHWNTKWNAYQLRIVRKSPLEFTFETAWDFPMPVFRKIAEEFPTLSFRCTCYDEGGNFAGDGFFNPNTLGPEFALCNASDELYERVYGQPPNVDDED